MISLVRRLSASVALMASVAPLAHAQSVLLQIKPKVGDTLRLLSPAGTEFVSR